MITDSDTTDISSEQDMMAMESWDISTEVTVDITEVTVTMEDMEEAEVAVAVMEEDGEGQRLNIIITDGCSQRDGAGEEDSNILNYVTSRELKGFY
jgi:hypothetical protein